MSKISYLASFLTSFCLAGVMGISIPITALAGNPSFSRFPNRRSVGASSG